MCNMNLTVTKIIVLFLIASLVLDSAMPAPIKCGEQNSRDAKINYKQRLFEGISPELWMNACYIDNSNNSIRSEPLSFTRYQEPLKIVLNSTKNSLENLAYINLTELPNWEENFGDDFKFLPERPKANSLLWHKQMQIYVATLAVLHNISRRYVECDVEDQMISEELQRIFRDAQQILCDIETFVNGTLQNKENGEFRKVPIIWWTDQEIMRKVNITDPEDPEYGIQRKTSYIFVLGRFQQYLHRLSKRVANFNPPDNLKSLPSARQEFRYRKCMRRQRRKQKCERFNPKNHRRQMKKQQVVLTTDKYGKYGKINRPTTRSTKSPNLNRQRKNRNNTKLNSRRL